MPFGFWYYAANVGGRIAFIAFAAALIFSKDGATSGLGLIALCYLIPLALAGTIMGILLCFDKLRMRCPFCGKSGPVGGSKADGMWMECETCGWIHGVGPLKLKLVKEKRNDE